MQHRIGISPVGRRQSEGIAHIGSSARAGRGGDRPGVVSGTSAGAIVGALYAAGHSWEESLEFFANHQPFRLSKITFGKPGLLDTEKIVPTSSLLPGGLLRGAGAQALHHRRPTSSPARLEVFASGPLIRPMIASVVRCPWSSRRPRRRAPLRRRRRHRQLPGLAAARLCDVILGVYASPLLDTVAGRAARELARHLAARLTRFGMFTRLRAACFQPVRLLLCRRASSSSG